MHAVLADPAIDARPVRHRVRDRVRALPAVGGSVVVLAALAVLLVLPAAGIVLGSFWSASPFQPGSHATLGTWAATLTDAAMWGDLGTSVIIAAFATVIAVPVATALALLVERTDVGARGMVNAAILINLLVSPLILATAWIGLASPQIGVLNDAAEAIGLGRPLNVYSYPGVVLVIVTWLVPFVYNSVRPAIANADPRLEEAARVAGSSHGRLLLTVVLPGIRPALVGATIIAFILTVQMFSIPALIGVPAQIVPLAYDIFRYTQVSPAEWERSAAVGVLLLILSVALVLLQRRIVGQARKYTSISIGGRPQRLRLGRGRVPATALVLLYLVVATVVPLIALVVSSFQRYSAGLGSSLAILTTDNYRSVVTDSGFGAALRNTLVVMIGCGAVLVVLALAVAIVAHAPRRRWAARLADIGARLPVALPGIVLGAGLLWVYFRIRLPIYGSIVIVMIAVITVFLPQIYNIVAGSYVQISPALREAAGLSGARPRRVMWDVDRPLVERSLLTAFAFAVVLSSTEINAQIMVYSSSSVTLPMRMWDLLSAGGSIPAASATAVVQLVVTVAFLLLAGAAGRAVRRRRAALRAALPTDLVATEP